MKPKFCIYPQPNYLTRTAIGREQKQFIKIAFAVHLFAVISAERYRSDGGALKSAVLHFVFFMIIINKMQQSAAQRCLKNSLLEVFPLTVGSGKTMAFENRRGKYKELGKKVPQAYRVYVEDTFLPCDAVIARIFSKEMTHTDNQGDNEEQKVKRYYYHSDHLGSAQFVTDWKGRQYEHIEYTPYGELWIEEVAAGLDKLPFRFTGKELDEETGLYYYGARYLDPKYSRWLSGDPALGEYIPKAPIDDEAKKHNENLPGMGGIYNTVNLHVYHYAGNNPVKYTDPNGKSLDVVDNGNGTYTVCGGIENSDKNIYLIVNGQRTGDVIGVMFTEHSFFDGGKVVAGAVINPNDSSGQEFLNDFKENTPSLFSYMPEGLNGKKYDFKDRGIGEGDNEQIYRHRGMPLGVDENGNKIFGTARDVGNYAAGYIAGKNALSWREARFGFDALQSAMDSIRNRSITISTEGPESQAAQYKGFIDGKANFNNAWKDLDIMF
ncbi:RHS repeat domain-containing protein [Treponema denticola]|uniref:RHS repeat domain-containing protein n=1 Tax=Treponema denticola TaxID=158 RepID=UPI002205413F|nr:RHS repeat-associated core domain-containing protein [Treponema denticola]UTC92683.1 RHS repeat-associated core domain-containing protein [Treponema denticola]